MRDLPALKDNTFFELKELIKRKFPENESIQKEEFEILDEDEFPISEDICSSFTNKIKNSNFHWVKRRNLIQVILLINFIQSKGQFGK